MEGLLKFLKNLAKSQKIQKPEPVYNNPGFYEMWNKFEGNEESVCYRYERINGQSVAVMNPKIDTLRFTLDTDSYVLREQIHKKMLELGNEWEPEDEEFTEIKFGKYMKHVVVEGLDEKIAIVIGRLAERIVFESITLSKACHIHPMPGHPFPIMLRG